MEITTGQFQIMQTHVLQHLMGIPGDAFGAIKELVDNSMDANASKIWIIRENNRVTIQDNGHGMVPHMTESDYEMLQLFKTELAQSNKPDDIRDLIDNPAAFASFVWAMECVGFSGKKRYFDSLKTKQAKQGMRGIGALSFNLIGNRQTWYSRPHGELARIYYGAQAVKEGSVPVALLRPPTREDIENHELNYEVEVLDERSMRDPVTNMILPGGTKVEITELQQGIDTILSTEFLAESLKKLYGKIIREGKCKIYIVDKTSGSSNVTEVQGTHYEGVLVHKATLKLRINSRNRPTFRVEIYYNDRATSSSPDLIRSGLAVNQITDLPELRRETPWSTGKLTGYIEFPTLPPADEARAWNAAKTSLQSTRFRDMWVEIISKEVGPQVAAKIEEIQSRAQDTALSSAFNQAAEAAMIAMEDIPMLSKLNFLQPVIPKSKKPTRGRRTIPTSVRASVIDENIMGVPDVFVELYRDNKLLYRLSTSLSGTVTFGRPGVGQYRFVVVLPTNSGYYSPDRKLDHSFELKNPDDGFRMVFPIITGRKKPDGSNKRVNFQLASTQLDPEIPYSIERLSNGLLLINSEGTSFKQALDRGDENLRNILIAEYISAGLVEWSLADYPVAQQHLVRSQMFATLAASMFGVKRRRRTV
jgi:hypothetical protein